MSFYSLQMLEKKIPCLFNDKPDTTDSSQYKLIRTGDIIVKFQDYGWIPWILEDELEELKSKPLTSAHIIRLRTHDDFGTIKDSSSNLHTEIIIINSSNTKTALQIRIGLFREICSNGMVVGEDIYPVFKMKHIGAVRDDLIEYIKNLPTQFKSFSGMLANMENRQLSQSEIYDMGKMSLLLKYKYKQLPTHQQIEDITTAQRFEDSSSDLWHVFNRIQENVINGNYFNSYTNEDGDNKLIKAKALTSNINSIDLNKQLFSLATQYLNSSSHA